MGPKQFLSFTGWKGSPICFDPVVLRSAGSYRADWLSYLRYGVTEVIGAGSYGSVCEACRTYVRFKITPRTQVLMGATIYGNRGRYNRSFGSSWKDRGTFCQSDPVDR